MRSQQRCGNVSLRVSSGSSEAERPRLVDMKCKSVFIIFVFVVFFFVCFGFFFFEDQLVISVTELSQVCNCIIFTVRCRTFNNY
uniref:Transmembrane protein n=1 Tax=Anguilla anguilla TaxID=7936 RepID=A0A0E9X8C8_ANGAN